MDRWTFLLAGPISLLCLISCLAVFLVPWRRFLRPKEHILTCYTYDIEKCVARNVPEHENKVTAETSILREKPHGDGTGNHDPRLPDYNTDHDDPPPKMLRQPKLRPISDDQLVAEVKGICAGLIMIETKCIEVDNAQSSKKDADSKLSNEQWQALTALHRTLLHEYCDFFLASQHPSASPALRKLASKYDMPARMWRYGIHPFLELLRHRLPASLEHILTFIYLAYGIMALLKETVPAFEGIWIECLGDLARYRVTIEYDTIVSTSEDTCVGCLGDLGDLGGKSMVIKDDDIRDREVWIGVSRRWYSQASHKSLMRGRL